MITDYGGEIGLLSDKWKIVLMYRFELIDSGIIICEYPGLHERMYSIVYRCSQTVVRVSLVVQKINFNNIHSNAITMLLQWNYILQVYIFFFYIVLFKVVRHVSQQIVMHECVRCDCIIRLTAQPIRTWSAVGLLTNIKGWLGMTVAQVFPSHNAPLTPQRIAVSHR